MNCVALIFFIFSTNRFFTDSFQLLMFATRDWRSEVRSTGFCVTEIPSLVTNTHEPSITSFHCWVGYGASIRGEYLFFYSHLMVNDRHHTNTRGLTLQRLGIFMVLLYWNWLTRVGGWTDLPQNLYCRPLRDSLNQTDVVKLVFNRKRCFALVFWTCGVTPIRIRTETWLSHMNHAYL